MSRQVCGFTLDDGPVLVTGAGGFVGRRLMDLFQLGQGDIAADCTSCFSAPPGVRRIAWPLPGSPSASLGQVRYVIHLAGLSSVANSISSAEKVMQVNTEGTRSVVQWIQEISPQALLLLTSSSEVYQPSVNMLDENSLIAPRSPYGESKLKAEELLAGSGIQYVVSRSFPHYGPGQSGNFVLPSFCRRVIRSVSNGEGTISTGNLTAVRDYLYIDDVVSAYAALLANGQAGSVYNVCSGIGRSIGELLSMILEIPGAGLRSVTEPHLLREEDQLIQIGNPEKLRDLGWALKFSLEEGLKVLYQWWEDRL